MGTQTEILSPELPLTAPKVAAGLLMYKWVIDKDADGEDEGKIVVFIVHPGGPSWEKQDVGAWSIPKGEVEELETCPLATAIREFLEETGFLPQAPYLKLGHITQKSGKIVHVWAFECYDYNPKDMKSNEIEIEHPKGSGIKITIPEVDRGDFFTLDQASVKLNPRQVPLLQTLRDLEIISNSKI